MIARKVTVTGRVQGVGFRWYAMNRARALGVTGWVTNNPDGSVTAWIEGADDDVDSMVSALKVGPPGSRIRDFFQEAAVPSGRFDGFDVTF